MNTGHAFFFHYRRWSVSLAVWLTSTALSFGLDVTDPAGDTTGPDITRLQYTSQGPNLELTLTFVQELTGHVINQDLYADVLLDVDRTAMTGFVDGPGLHTRFGIDYRIEVFLSGFGSTADSATLQYWRRKPSATPPYVELERVQVALGDPLDPNGSVFVVGANPTYGTDRHQVFLRVPTNLLANAAFPICGEGDPLCINELFPCPLPLVRDPRQALVSVFVTSVYSTLAAPDLLPDSGMFDALTGTNIPNFPTGPEDLVAQVSDSANDGLAQPGINGDELLRFRAFQHPGGVLAFELQLLSYTLEDTARYYVLLDLDNNPATGEPFTNGTQVLGLDLVASYGNFQNPVGEANPLEGTLYFWRTNAWCPLVYIDYLAQVWRGSPGYVYLSLPPQFTAPYLSANTSGLIQAVAATEDPEVIFLGYNDLAPNTGGLSYPVTSVLQVESITPIAGPALRLRFWWWGTGPLTFAVESAAALGAPWAFTPATVVSPLGNGLFQADVPQTLGESQRFYRLVALR